MIITQTMYAIVTKTPAGDAIIGAALPELCLAEETMEVMKQSIREGLTDPHTTGADIKIAADMLDHMHVMKIVATGEVA